MLYLLYEHFGINLFQYITVRAGFAFFTAFFFTLYLLPKFIRWAIAKTPTNPSTPWLPKTINKSPKPPLWEGSSS